jgi:Kef-type K+ transport system membrane component KefB
LSFVAIFMAMVGLEEWLNVALIEERAALLALPVLALSALGTIGFTVRCAFVRRAQPRTD